MKNSLTKLIVLPFTLLVLSIFTTKPSYSQTTSLPAFPGAMGFGSQTVGGRGGQIIKVTNLNDSGPGSLRQAVQFTTGPRIVVFDVAGIIDLQNNISIPHPYVTVAGQTAPGDGVTLRSATIDVETHDVIVRGLKFRPGDLAAGQTPRSRDAFSVSAPWGSTGTQTYNVIIDHNEMAWGIDENVQVWGSEVAGNVDAVKNVTFSWNFVYEGLANSINPDGTQGMAFLIGDYNSNISVHHNLVAHHNDRSPRVDNIKNFEFMNNVIYNWGGTPSRIDHDSTANWINNYYKPGPASSTRELKFDDNLNYAVSKIYVEGNYVDASTNRSYSNTSVRYPSDDSTAIILQQNNGDVLNWYTANPPVIRSLQPVFTQNFAPDEATTVYASVMAHAGVFHKDSVTNRVLDSISNRNGQMIDSPSQIGGWPVVPAYTVKPDLDSDGMPDEWEQQYGLNTNQNDSAQDPDNDGYTNIEEYINSLLTIPGYSSGSPTTSTSNSPTPEVTPSPNTSPSPTNCPTDINQDGVTSLFDYSLLINDFFKAVPNLSNPRADINSDGIVNILDYSLLVSNFMKSC